MPTFRRKPIDVEGIVYTGIGSDHEGGNAQTIADFMQEQSVGQMIQPYSAGDRRTIHCASGLPRSRLGGVSLLAMQY